MKTLSVNEMVDEMASAGSMTKSAARDALTAIATVTQRVLARGDAIKIVGVGVLEPKERPARKGRNPGTGEVIDVAASTTVKFKPAKELRDSL